MSLVINSNENSLGEIISNREFNPYMDIKQIQMIGDYSFNTGGTANQNTMTRGLYTLPDYGISSDILSPFCYEFTSVEGDFYGRSMTPPYSGNLESGKFSYAFISAGLKSYFSFNGGEVIGKKIYAQCGINNQVYAGSITNARGILHNKITFIVGLLHTDSTKTVIATKTIEYTNGTGQEQYMRDCKTEVVPLFEIDTQGVIAQSGDKLYVNFINEINIEILFAIDWSSFSKKRMALSFGYTGGPIKNQGFDAIPSGTKGLKIGPLPVQISID